MAQFGFQDFQRTAIAIVGALVFSTVFVGAAVGPAHAVEAAQAQSYAAADVQLQDRARA